MELKEFAHLVIDYFIETRDFVFDIYKIKSHYNLTSYDVRNVYNVEVLKETFNHLYKTLTYKYEGTEHRFIKAELAEFMINLLKIINRTVKYKDVQYNNSNDIQTKISYFRFLLFNLLEDFVDNLKNINHNKEDLKLYVASLLSNFTHVLLLLYLKRNGVLSKDLYRMCLRM